MIRFLVDECLSPDLTAMAHARGHAESSHIVWRGWAGFKDWELKPMILQGDWTFVTKNSADFRGPSGAPGSRGEYAGLDLHAGLVCLNGPPGMDLDMQRELFEEALAEVDQDPDLVNTVLEVTLDGDELRVLRYSLPAD